MAIADPVEKDLASLRSTPVAMAATKTSHCGTALSLPHQLGVIFRVKTRGSSLLCMSNSFSAVATL